MIAKITIRENIQARLNNIQELWGFNRHGGMDQIPAIALDFAIEQEKAGNVRTEYSAILLRVTVAWGRYIELVHLAEDCGFVMDYVPEGFCEYVICLDGVAYSRYRRRLD